MDWGVGRYERIAAQLRPAAAAVIEHATPRRGERVLDVGCGTGNAALLAAERGGLVTGVDPARRLLDVARAEASARGLDVECICADAASLPLTDAVVDVVVSVFGVIFAPDASSAAAEMARACALRGRIVLSAWLPDAVISAVAGLRREAVAKALGEPAGPAPFSWHDGDALAGLLAPHGFTVDLHEERLAFRADSAQDFIDAELRDHPAWIAALAVLEPKGEAEAVRARALEIFEGGNEDPAAFCVTSSYVVAVARREAADSLPDS